MKCTSIHPGLTCLIVFLLVAQFAPGVYGKWYDGLRPKKDPDDKREFVKGKGADLVIHSGDTVITSLAPNRWLLKPPYRWFYAINNRGSVIHFLPKIHKWFKNVKPTRIDVRSKYKKTKLQNRGQKAGHIGKVGSLVAALMLESTAHQKLRFHFNLFWCNCKHYTEYLSLGMVKGSRRKLLFQRMDKKCPLYATLTRDMYDSILKSKEFTLHDGQKGEKQVKIHLKVHEWPEYIYDH